MDVDLVRRPRNEYLLRCWGLLEKKETCIEASTVHRSQIVDILSHAAKGDMTARDACNLHGISEQAFYRWRVSTARWAPPRSSASK